MSETVFPCRAIGMIRTDHLIDATRNGWQDERDEETARRRGRRRYMG